MKARVIAPKQAGVSLITVMVALAFISIFVWATIGGITQSALFRRTVASGEAYSDVGDNLQAVVASNLRSELKAATGGACATGSLRWPAQPLGATGITVSKSPDVGTLPGSAPAYMVAAAGRCQKRGVRAMSGSNDIYLCLKFTGIQNKTVANTTLAGATLAFAEIRARVFDVGSGTTLSCAAYQQILSANTPTAALDVTYSIYWYTGGVGSAQQSQPIYSHHNTAFYAAAL